MTAVRTLTVEDATGTCQIEVTVGPNPTGGVEVDVLTVRRLPGGPPITSDHLRRVPVAEVVRRAIAEHEGAQRVPQLSPEESARLRKGGPTAEALQLTADVYRAGLAAHRPPTVEVERVLRIPRSTIGVWIRLCRDRGYLGPSRGRGRSAG